MTSPAAGPDTSSSGADSFIDEVRALKQAASERFGHDLNRIAEHLRRIELAHPSPPVQPPKVEQSGMVL